MYSMGMSRSFGNPWGGGGFGGGGFNSFMGGGFGGGGFGGGFGFPSFNFQPPRDPRLGPEREAPALGQGYFQDTAQVAATPESGTVKQPAPTGQGGFNFSPWSRFGGGGFRGFNPFGGFGFGGGFGGYNPWANPFGGFGGGGGFSPLIPYM